MTRRWLPAAATLFLLVALVTAAQQVDTSVRPQTDTQAPMETQAPASASPGARQLSPTDAGFDFDLPPGWVSMDRSDQVNRRTVRLLVITNRPPVVPTEAGTIRWDQLPADHVSLELLAFGGPGGPGPDGESTFPLDWSQAQPSIDGYGDPMLTLRFQHLLRPLTLAAHFGASASDGAKQTLGRIVASMRPEPVPTSGTYRGWDVLGPLNSLPVGSVNHYDTPQSRAGGFYLVRGTQKVYAHLDHAFQFMGAMKPCPIRYDPLARLFICDATGDAWTRTGKQVTGGGLFGLAYHYGFVKDGLVLVGGGSTSSGGPSVDDAAEFSDAVSAPPAATAPMRREMLDRYAQITRTSPTERAAAKLVTRETALASEVVRGAHIRPDIARVWVIAFAGPVQAPGFAEAHGRWTVFIADAATGGVITAACCGDGTWPQGFDGLPDLAPVER